ncbi:LamG-like jellyroll fold domain-containing protein [Allomuricauda sp. R78024]|uniref:LamG-like jellyroll fold domain-containing protein n=1 Tax=Allomuricauda sp. R78024 TaxID=3093867 RepID=UPI0037CBC2DA
MKSNNIVLIVRSFGLLTIFLLTLGSCARNDDGYPEESNVDSALLPQASFSASATSVEAGSTVTFTNTSINSPSLYTWVLPGATPSYTNEASPTVLYESSGVYDVTLRVRNSIGGGEVFMEGHIEITAPPIIDIDIKAQIRYTFEDNLNSDLDKGLQDITATSAGAETYDIRPGGGGSYVFTGSNALTVPGYTGINGAGSRSVALWVKTTHGSTSALVHWGNTGTFSRSSFKYQSSGVIRFEYQGGGHNGNTTVNDGEWHHVAYTYDGDTIKLYVDGVEDFTISGITVLNTGNTGETDINIGSQLGGSIFQGAIDDVRIFDTVLTSDEVRILSEIK